MALMGLDVGTTGVKCTITDDSGIVLAETYKEYKTTSPKHGYYELNPNDVWNSTKQVIKGAMEKTPEKILAVSVSSFGESFVCVDKNGKVLMNSMVYTDVRGVDEIEQLCKNIPAETIMEKTGLKPSSTYSLGKIMWIKQNRPEIYSEIHKVFLFGSYILYCLGGVEAIDYTLAARSMALNVKERAWDKAILQAAGILEEIFPEVYPMGTIVGTIDENLAKELGVSPDMKLVTGAHDQICAAIGSGSVKPGEAMDGMGSVDCIAPVYSDDVDHHINALNNYPAVPYLNDKYTTYAYIYDGGALLKWYRNTFCGEEVEEAKRKNINVYDLFNQYAANEPTEILVLPHFSGAALPYMDPFSKGAIIGMEASTDKPKFYRALLEGVAYELRYNIETLEQSGIRIDRLRACGGGSRSDVWLQIKADVFDREIHVVKMKEAGTLGVIIMAGVAAGVFESFEAAMDKLVKIEKVFYPNPVNVEKYNQNFAKYKKIYRMQKEILYGEVE